MNNAKQCTNSALLLLSPKAEMRVGKKEGKMQNAKRDFHPDPNTYLGSIDSLTKSPSFFLYKFFY